MSLGTRPCVKEQAQVRTLYQTDTPLVKSLPNFVAPYALCPTFWNFLLAMEENQYLKDLCFLDEMFDTLFDSSRTERLQSAKLSGLIVGRIASDQLESSQTERQHCTRVDEKGSRADWSPQGKTSSICTHKYQDQLEHGTSFFHFHWSDMICRRIHSSSADVI